MSRNPRGDSSSEEPALIALGSDREQPVLSFPIVGVGASAGGLEAFRELLSALPPDTGMAFVLLLHLPPDHDSQLSEILRRVCALPLYQVHDRMEVQPNKVYVVPGGSDLEIHENRLALVPRQAAPGRFRPIDHFFQCLAAYQGTRAIGVVLSGTASDGTLGIEEIKAAGGITFAQDDTAQHTSMPRTAAATGMVDFVLSARDIAEELGRIAKHPLVNAPPDGPAIPFDLQPVLETLNKSIGIDFTDYKPNTLYRRIARRIVLHKLDGISDYVRLLQSDAAEAESLYQDILINVTSFFRNPEAFDALKTEAFPKITANRSRHDPVRIWTLGCSTGEEAYSIAMAFTEFLEANQLSLPMQIFGTDLNGVSIDKARLGVYSKTAVEQVSEERLRRFFVQIDGSYRVAKAIRESCIFARHNVLTDPPFSRIDLVSCRNMLIYLGQELQQKVIPILHYALRPNGFLWLGTSETIGSYRDLFELVENRHKIYAKSTTGARMPGGFMLEPRTPVPGFGTGARAPQPAPPSGDTYREADRLLLARYAPPSVLVRSDLEILQYRGNTATFLAPTPGRASLNLLKMLREGLVLGVRSAIEEAGNSEVPVRREDLWLTLDGRERQVAVEVIPVRTGVERAGTFMVIFEDLSESEIAAHLPAQPAALSEDAASHEIAKLKQELSATREYLQSVIEQQEAANEELQSANEEVQSTNEELQSINEELETSKEEVQSSNEELATVNDELHSRNAELAQSNNDLMNLLSSVQIAIVMLGPNLRIRRFTPMAEKLLNLIPADIGRPLSDIKLKLDVPDIDQLVRDAVDTLAGHEREVQDDHRNWYLLRIRPYRTIENKIDGAVVVLIDVNSLKRSQEMLRQQTELLNQAHEPIIMWELDGEINYWNNAAEETYGYTRDQALGRQPHELLVTSPGYETFRDALQQNHRWSGELIHTRRDGQQIIVESRMVTVENTEGRRLVVEANRPITERKESERILRRVADDLVAADRHKDEFLAMLAHELRNPLAPLRSVVGVLQSELAQAADKAKALEIMDRQISSMARLLDDLLDVSRITLSQIELRRERVELVNAMRRVVEQNASYFQMRQQLLHVNLPQQPLHIEADPVRLEQIVGNLLNNASKYTQRGGEIFLTVEHTPDEDETAGGRPDILIRVSDNGMGIAPGKLPHVFDMFMRATRSINQEHGGLGVGLTLVRRLTELHGGKVEVYSAGVGKGSEFVVRLPAAQDHVPALQREPVDSPKAGSTKRRILVVDDGSDNRESLAMTLRTAGHEVEIADGGRSALELGASFKPEVVLMDIGMPDMDGYELALHLRQQSQTRNAALIAFSGFGDEDAKQRARDAGIDHYLVKPVSIADITAAVDHVAAGDRASS